MPTPDPTTADRGRPVRLTATATDLGAARAVVHANARHAFVTIGTVDVSLGLVDRPEVVRQLLSDALAQLDAIAAE